MCKHFLFSCLHVKSTYCTFHYGFSQSKQSESRQTDFAKTVCISIQYVPFKQRNIAFDYLSPHNRLQWSLTLLRFWTSPISFSGRAQGFPDMVRVSYTAMLWKQSHRILLLSAQRQNVLSSRGEQPYRLSWGLVVAVVENQGLLDCKEGKRPVPHVGRGNPTAELALQSCAELQGPVCAPPLQNHHLAHAEQKQGQIAD